MSKSIFKSGEFVRFITDFEERIQDMAEANMLLKLVFPSLPEGELKERCKESLAKLYEH